MRLDDAALIEKIIGTLKDSELKEVMDEMSVDETLEIIEDMPTEVVRRIAEKDEILRLLEERNFRVLKPLLNEFNATDLAAVLDEVPKEDVALIFRILPKELAAETFVENERRHETRAYTAFKRQRTKSRPWTSCFSTIRSILLRKCRPTS